MPFIQKLRAHVAKTFKVFDGKCQVFIPAEKTDAKNPKWYVQPYSVYVFGSELCLRHLGVVSVRDDKVLQFVIGLFFVLGFFLSLFAFSSRLG